MFFRVWTNAFSMLLLATLCFASAGCGGASKGKAVVKGQVTIGGKPLYTGSVVFHTSDGRTGGAAIDQHGNYNMGDAPIGDVKVTVTASKTLGKPGARPSTKNPTGEMKDPNKPSEGSNEPPVDPSKIVPIPDKYGDPEKSGLTYKVEKGEQTHNIDLKP